MQQVKKDHTIIPVMQQNKTFISEVKGTQYTYYLTGPIVEPDEYIDLCNILRNASPQDEVVIRINSRGGSVASERMIVNAIQECQANVKGFIEYDCMSAATGVFLACHEHYWADHIQFMAHCSWWGAVGKNPDIRSQTEFGLRQMDEEIIATYSGFLTEDELKELNNGKEFWFGSKELAERMEMFYAYHASRLADEDGQEGDVEEHKTLDQMIEEAVSSFYKKLKKDFEITPKVKATKATKSPSPTTA